jgi:c-di-GMP-binding flagellar brake protein YcgR
MAEEKFMLRVRKADIEVGKPLPFAIYDADRNLLLNRGVVVISEHQVETLLKKGLFREGARERIGHVAARLDELKPGENTGAPAKQKEESVSLDAIKLMPGDALQLQPMLEGQSERYTVHVIGLMKGKSVLVTAPVMDGKAIFVRDGQPFLVRAFSGLNISAFKSRVLKSQFQPFPYLHLSYPDVVQTMRIRKAMRAPTSIIVAAHQSEEGKQVGAGKLVDISVGGGKMLSPSNLGSKGDTVWLSFKLTLGDIEEYVKTPVVICSVGEEDDDQGKRIKFFGIQFIQLDQSEQLMIMNLVYQHLLKDTA